MTAGSEKRMLSAPNSKLAKADIVQALSQDGAWECLSLETRERLYSLLPPQPEDQAPHNPDVNPLQTPLGKEIEDGLRRWQDDLQEGRESKKWMQEAMQAGRDRDKYAALLEEQREGERSVQGGGKEDGDDDGYNKS